MKCDIDPGKKVIPGDTVLIFDELQDFPEISTSPKFFCQDGKFDVICSGSGRSNTLRTLPDGADYPDIRFGIKLTNGNIGYHDGIYTFPLFCAFVLKEYLKTVPSGSLLE